jgi:polyisoprenoid-binding protein YceI
MAAVEHHVRADAAKSVGSSSSATTKISRKDFGLVWNAVLETGGVGEGDDVKINLDLPFQRKADVPR